MFVGEAAYWVVAGSRFHRTVGEPWAERRIAYFAAGTPAASFPFAQFDLETGARHTLVARATVVVETSAATFVEASAAPFAVASAAAGVVGISVGVVIAASCVAEFAAAGAAVTFAAVVAAVADAMAKKPVPAAS